VKDTVYMNKERKKGR